MLAVNSENLHPAFELHIYDEKRLLSPAVAEGDVAVYLTMSFDKTDCVVRRIKDPLWERTGLVE